MVSAGRVVVTALAVGSWVAAAPAAKEPPKVVSPIVGQWEGVRVVRALPRAQSVVEYMK